MKTQFEVWNYHFGERGGDHPCVIVSNPDISSRAKYVNVLFCTSQRQIRKLYPFEVLLNGADGMDWETFCDCSMMVLVESAKLFGKRGRVTHERRNQIRDKVRDIFRLAARD